MWKFLAGIVVGAVGAVLISDSLAKQEKVTTGDVSESIEESDAGTDNVWKEYAAV